MDEEWRRTPAQPPARVWNHGRMEARQCCQSFCSPFLFA